MKESMSITWIFQIVIFFIFLFTAIMAFTINNSNAFGVKDEIVNIIEQNEGNFFTSNGLNSDVVAAIDEAAYRTNGKCPTDLDGFIGFDRNGNPVASGEKAAVCIREVSVKGGLDSYLMNDAGLGSSVATGDNLQAVYYQVLVFYQLDIPVVSHSYNFTTKGETRIIYKNR